MYCIACMYIDKPVLSINPNLYYKQSGTLIMLNYIHAYSALYVPPNIACG